MTKVFVLGAEKQAAVSAALAYPEREFVFVSDYPVIDGWDLPNVTIRHGSPQTFQLPLHAETILMCPRWLAAKADARSTESYRLTHLVPSLRSALGETIIEVNSTSNDDSRLVVKGDLRHRPDATVIGHAPEIRNTPDPHGVGVAFQRWIDGSDTIFAVGRRRGPSEITLGIIRVYKEFQCRESLVLAGETYDSRQIVDATIGALEHVDHRGDFTLNWLVVGNRNLISSFRPVARAVFQALRAGGAGILDQQRNINVARSGVKFVADQHYSSYRRNVG